MWFGAIVGVAELEVASHIGHISSLRVGSKSDSCYWVHSAGKMTVVCLIEFTTWDCRALSSGTLVLKEALRGKNCVAIATAPLGPEVTGLFKGSTLFTPPAAAAGQQGLCTQSPCATASSL